MFTRHSNRHAPRNAEGRKVRSKIRWFTEFCNSHYLSHFAAFFIDARAKRSVVESCTKCVTRRRRGAVTPLRQAQKDARDDGQVLLLCVVVVDRDGRRRKGVAHAAPPTLSKCTGAGRIGPSGDEHVPLPFGEKGQHRATAGPRRSSLMILPQVHLRKPCYDFYFL